MRYGLVLTVAVLACVTPVAVHPENRIGLRLLDLPGRRSDQIGPPEIPLAVRHSARPRSRIAISSHLPINIRISAP